MSDTPRTDRVIVKLPRLLDGVLAEAVAADFARTLERELSDMVKISNELLAEREALRFKLEAVKVERDNFEKAALEYQRRLHGVQLENK